MSTQPPVGLRFSLAYAKAGPPLQDSARFRGRVGHFLDAYVAGDHGVQTALRLELNITLVADYDTSGWHGFLTDAPLPQVFDTLTETIKVLRQRGRPYRSEGLNVQTLQDFISRVFQEEHLAYLLDAGGGVRYRHDEELERNLAATIGGLEPERFAGARQSFEKSRAALSQATPDTLSAVNDAFRAVENVFRLLTGASLLGTNDVKKEVKRLVDTKYGQVATDAGRLMADSFADWVTASHLYRHAPEEPGPVAPPLDLAVVMVSSAAAYLRWLLELDRAGAG